MLILACADQLQMCCDMAPFLRIVNLLIKIIQFTVPAILIILGAVDMFKAMTKNDEKASTDTTKKFGKRVIFGIIIFMVPVLVQVILEFVETTFVKETNLNDPQLPGFTAWVSCWNNIDDKNFCKSQGCENIYDKNEINTDDSNGGGQSSSNNGNANNGSENPEVSKVCYSWGYASCSNSRLESIRGQDIYFIANIGTPKYNYNINKCQVNVTTKTSIENGTVVSNATYENCNNVCIAIGAMITGNTANTNTCSCQFDPNIESKSGENLPTEAIGGEVNNYSCSNTTNCSDYNTIKNFCNGPTGRTKVNEQ